MHSTDRYRATAEPKYGTFSQAAARDVEWPQLLPPGALMPLA